MSKRKLLMIINPKAGRTKSREPLFDACVAFSQAGYLLSVRTTRSPADAVRIAAEEGAKFDVVVAVGGDGTLNQVVSGLNHLERPPLLGYMAQGSTNDFASTLNISKDPLVAAESIIHGEPRHLDVGFWNERCFVYVASFGAFTRSSYSAPQAAKNALGHFAYILEGMKDLSTLRPYKVRITADGEVLDGEYLFGAVCNSISIGGLMKLSPERVILDDGKFELLLIRNPKDIMELRDCVRALQQKTGTSTL